ncbi:MAG: hypothetical protein VZS44_10295 [Bacilli bacterium]|nr:hypothetical protein [Bacilli bacterium]
MTNVYKDYSADRMSEITLLSQNGYLPIFRQIEKRAKDGHHYVLIPKSCIEANCKDKISEVIWILGKLGYDVQEKLDRVASGNGIETVPALLIKW